MLGLEFWQLAVLALAFHFGVARVCHALFVTVGKKGSGAGVPFRTKAAAYLLFVAFWEVGLALFLVVSAVVSVAVAAVLVLSFFLEMYGTSAKRT